MYNASKHSITLNLKNPGVVHLIYRLIEEWQPDIIAECFTPGKLIFDSRKIKVP